MTVTGRRAAKHSNSVTEMTPFQTVGDPHVTTQKANIEHGVTRRHTQARSKVPTLPRWCAMKIKTLKGGRPDPVVQLRCHVESVRALRFGGRSV